MLIFVPDLLIYEIANVLRYKPDLTQLQVQEALTSLYDMQIRTVEISQTVIMEAIQLAYFHAITVYDATFIAMAKYLKVPFITAENLPKRITPLFLFLHTALYLSVCL
jgi:predicted nucleic acid-binding protein